MTNQPEPIRKSSLPTTPPPEWEFFTFFPYPDDDGGDMVRGQRQRGVQVRRLVTYGDWEPVRPDRWADEPAPAAVSAAVAPLTDRAADEVDADTVANRAAQVITTMGAEIRELKHSRDRYRTAWLSAWHRAGVLSAEVTRRAPLLGKYAAEIERLRAELESERDISRRLLAQRQEMAEERYAWQQRGDRAETELRRMADETATETPKDTLPAWLYQRFMPDGIGWDQLDEDDRSYWEHQARAVRRAVARGGFKQPAAGARQDAE